ncbi:class I ribonucleotide reductase maintenance protein YfaE [Bacterioplanoides sp.]|uniref:class I ribonucleotide reductase maintenance protein YfaE n=1 Tax=Bacterioplanoides sp. TaxID=2066072 RepID=UPI003AFFEC67
MPAAALAMPDNKDNAFQLSAEPLSHDSFELEPVIPEVDDQSIQGELYLPEGNAEQPEADPQIEFDGMAKPVYAVAVEHGNNTQAVQFQHAKTLLDSLESQQVDVHYQCREGYCGSCRVQLLEGEVHYSEEPMAWVNEDEILPCCCIPKSDLKIKID